MEDVLGAGSCHSGDRHPTNDRPASCRPRSVPGGPLGARARQFHSLAGVNPLQTTWLERGTVISRVALLPRTDEVQPWFGRFVPRSDLRPRTRFPVPAGIWYRAPANIRICRARASPVLQGAPGVAAPCRGARRMRGALYRASRGTPDPAVQGASGPDASGTSKSAIRVVLPLREQVDQKFRVRPLHARRPVPVLPTQKKRYSACWKGAGDGRDPAGGVPGPPQYFGAEQEGGDTTAPGVPA